MANEQSDFIDAGKMAAIGTRHKLKHPCKSSPQNPHMKNLTFHDS